MEQWTLEEEKLINKMIFSFGKYKGEKIIEIAVKDPSYIQWCIKNVSQFPKSNYLKTKIEMEFLTENGYYNKKQEEERLEVTRKRRFEREKIVDEAVKRYFEIDDPQEREDYYESFKGDIGKDVHAEIFFEKEHRHHYRTLTLANGETIEVPRSVVDPGYDEY